MFVSQVGQKVEGLFRLAGMAMERDARSESFGGVTVLPEVGNLGSSHRDAPCRETFLPRLRFKYRHAP